jgi:zinc protease
METARWLDRLGIGFDASAGYAVAIASVHTLSDVVEEAIEFLGTAVRAPTFPEREVDRVRGERLDEIDRQIDEPATVAGHALIEALYGDGLYGRPTGGTRPSVESITSEHLRDFHAARYRPGKAVLFAAGDVTPERLAEAVGRHLGGWTGSADRPDAPPTPETPDPRVILIDRPDSAQAEIRVATIGVPYGTDDYFAIVLANAVLGGLFNSRINMNLREDKGWTYGARSGFRFRRGSGPFVAQTAVETRVTADAFGEILDEIEKMRQDLVTEEELDLARHALTLSLPLQFETAADVTRRISRQHIYDLPADYWTAYRDRIEGVSAEEIRDVCRTYLGRDRLTLLAVTDADQTAEGLSRFGDVERRAVSGQGE